MVNRILISPSVVRVSLPGVEVTSPPALTEEYLALDSSWPKVERLHAVGVVLNQAVGDAGFSFNFSSLSSPPLAIIQRATPGTKTMRDVWVNYTIRSNVPYYWDHYFAESTVSSIIITSTWSQFFAEDGRGTPWDWYFFVFKP